MTTRFVTDAVSGARPWRAWVDGRWLDAPLTTRGRTTRTPEPWPDEQAELARDLAALISMGLVVAVDDGSEIRYVATGGEEVLP
jgi:hypothetical protein